MTLEYGGRRKEVALGLGNCAIALFRKRPEMDYLAIHHQHEDEMRWTYVFNKHALVYWMGGIALTKEGQRSIYLADREHGSFESRHGFRPDVIIEDYPSQHEVDAYIEFQAEVMDNDSAMQVDFTNALREDFSDE
jgi:hypothetical protein